MSAPPHRYVGYQPAPHEERRPARGHRSAVTHHHHVPTESREEFDRSGRLLTLGTVFMMLGLILYFGGGFLFVAAYNGVYPVIKIPVQPEVHSYYWWVGPTCFFIGLFMFILAFATFCKGLKCNRRTEHAEGYF